MLIGIYRELVDETGMNVVVTYPADRFPFCVGYLFDRDKQPDEWECSQYINSEGEWREYAEDHFGKGNWEIRDLEDE